MKNKIADLHVHSGMKGYANHGYPGNEGLTIWDCFPRKEKELSELNFAIRGVLKEIAKESQAHLDACAEGHVLTPFISITPPERPMFALESRKPFRRIISLLLPKRMYATLAVAVTGFPAEKVSKILKRVAANKGIDYYREEYLKEKKYLLDQTQVSSKKHPELKYRFAKNYKEFQELIDDGNSIVSILTVEGAHSFGNYPNHNTFKKPYKDLAAEEKKVLRESFLKNIKEVKNQEHIPFFVTFSHHFNNLLAGHARSMSPRSSLISFLGWPNVPGMRHIFNQEPNLNKGFSPLGKEVLKLFLDKEKGQRILIDAKHLSIASRREFYDLIKRKRKEEKDPIPILYSHAAVSGWPTLTEAARHEEDKNLDKDTYFSRWQINLTDEDILNIYDSDGMIGLVLHEDRMPGGAFKKKAKKLKKKIEKYGKKNDPEKEIMSIVFWLTILLLITYGKVKKSSKVFNLM